MSTVKFNFFELSFCFPLNINSKHDKMPSERGEVLLKTTTTAERLKYLMKTRNLKQVDILRAAEPYAEQFNIKIHRSDISQYVSGKVEPGQDKLIR